MYTLIWTLIVEDSIQEMGKTGPLPLKTIVEKIPLLWGYVDATLQDPPLVWSYKIIDAHGRTRDADYFVNGKWYSVIDRVYSIETLYIPEGCEPPVYPA